MFKMINWIFISPDGPTKVPYNRSLYVQEHCAIIECENKKSKPAHSLVQLVNLDDRNYQHEEWFLEHQDLLVILL